DQGEPPGQCGRDLHPRAAAAPGDLDEHPGPAVQGLGIVEGPDQVDSGDPTGEASEIGRSAPSRHEEAGLGQSLSYPGKGLAEEVLETREVGVPAGETP